MIKIWLDDERPTPEGWQGFKSARMLISALDIMKRAGESDIVLSLDHDLGDDEARGTGYDVIKWIEEQVSTDESYIPPVVHVHSANPVGRKDMLAGAKKISEARSERAQKA